MADAQVAVRFAVKDAEVVRQALANLGKDGEAALRRFDAAAKPVPKTLTAVSDVVADLKGRAAALAGSTGIAGTALLGLGPVGLTVAAALGAVYLAFDRIKEGAKAAGVYARDIRDFANATGFSTAQVQALSDVLQQNGIAQDKARSGLEKFSVAREEARRGDGELYQTLRRTSAALAEQFAASRSAPEALGVFIKALQQADETTRAFLARAAFGRGGVAFAQSLLDIAGRGGLGAITEAAIKAGAALDAGLIEKQAQAAIDAERKAQIVERNWNQAYGNIYKQWKDFLKNVLGLDANNEIAISLKVRIATENAGKSFSDMTDEGLAAEIERTRRRIAQIEAGAQPVIPGGGRPKLNLADPLGFKDEWQKQLDELIAERQRRRVLMEDAGREAMRARALTDLPADKPVSKEDEIGRRERITKAERERLSVLGDTASMDELLKAKDNDLALIRLKNINITKVDTDRVRENFAIQLAAREVAIKSQLGVVTATDLYVQKQRELNQLLSLGKISEEQYGAALAIARKEIDETIKAQEVRASSFPNLVRLRQEGENLTGTLDQELSGALRSTTSDILAMAKGTETLGAGLGNIASRMADAVAQALLMKSVVGPLAGLLSGGLGSVFGGVASGATFGAPSGGIGSYGGVPVPTFAGGGVIQPGGLALVSEHSAGGGRFIRAGREPITVTPYDVGGGGGSVTVHAGTTINIEGSADRTTLALIQQELDRRDAAMQSRVEAAVKRARSNRSI
jgi:hypothetical protein